MFQNLVIELERFQLLLLGSESAMVDLNLILGFKLYLCVNWLKG